MRGQSETVYCAAMPDEPKPPRRAADRTSLLVTTGMIALAAIGIATIFADPILAAFSPPPAAEASPTPAPSATVPPAAAVDGGHP